MNNLLTLLKKEFFNSLKKLNDFLSKSFGYFEKKKFIELIKNFIYDRRFVVIGIVTILSIFAHLSTPAFYNDKWVLGKIKNQLEDEFNIEFILPEKVSYSMFPPSFHLTDVGFSKKGREFAKVQKMKLNLSYKKFLNKEKINIQDIFINNSKFEIFTQDIDNFIRFFDKEINNKKLFIKNSKVFFKNENDEVYLLLALDKSTSYFDKKSLNNILNIEGNVFNNPLNLNFKNNYITKKSKLNFELNKVRKKFNVDLDYLNNLKTILFELIDGSKSYITNIEFDKNELNFSSIKDKNNKILYKGNIKFKPFNSKININLEKFDLMEIFEQSGLFMQIMNSGILINSNLNYKLELKADKIKNHRLLKNFILCLNFNQKYFSFDNSELIFDDNVKINIKNSNYVIDNKENYFYGDLNFKIKNSDKLFKFFQTKKKFRKNLNNINLRLKYNFNDFTYSIESIKVNNQDNDKIQVVIDRYNKKNIENFRKIEIRNFFNEIVSIL